jgi:hypothetical protein
MKAIVVVSSMLPICILPSASSWAADREETIGRWKYLTIEDKMDDTTRYIAYVTALEGESVFIFKCDKPGPKSVYMGFISDQEAIRKAQEA